MDAVWIHLPTQQSTTCICITQCGKNSLSFAEQMFNLGQYHPRGMHKWYGGQCNFTHLLCAHVVNTLLPRSLRQRPLLAMNLMLLHMRLS